MSIVIAQPQLLDVAAGEFYQAISAQAGAVQEQWATTSGVSAGSYAAAEAANAAAIR